MALQIGDPAVDFTPVRTTEMGQTAQSSSEFESRNTNPIEVLGFYFISLSLGAGLSI